MVKTMATIQPKGLRQIDGDHVWYIYGGYYEYLFTGTEAEFRIVTD